MFRLVRRVALVSMVVLPPIIGLSAASAGAATLLAANPPNVNLIGSGSSVTFDPSKLSVTDTKNGDCTPAHGEWTMTNTTSAKQVILEQGSKLFSLPPGEEVASCSVGSPGTYVDIFTLRSSPHAKLRLKTTIP